MNEANYKLRIAKNNTEVEVVGDKTFVETKFKELVNKYLNGSGNLSDSVSKKIGTTIAQTKLGKPSINLIDFVNQKNPRTTATELMPVLVYYAKHFEGLKQFDESDIKNLYKRYDISKRPKNIYQAIIDINRNKGYFESVPRAKGYFRLTEAGEHFIEVKLSKKL